MTRAFMRWLFFALTLAFAAPGWAQDYNKGLEAFDRGDYATALREWRPLAEQGDARAQFGVGYIYGSGEGVPQDYAEAAGWYRRAANQGNARAQVSLAIMLDYGKAEAEGSDRAVEAHMWALVAGASGEPQAHALAENLKSIIPETQQMGLDQINEAHRLARE